MNFKRLLLLLVTLSILAASAYAQEPGDVVPQTDAAAEAIADGAAEAESGTPTDAVPAEEGGFFAKIDSAMGTANGALASVFFYPIPVGGGNSVPLLVAWLVLGALFFTIRMRFINLRGFTHAINVTRGKYTDPNAHGTGEVTHFQALASALSATVGLGNIAGVAIAISLGGPGATFWMIMAGVLGMSSKFVECTLGQKYREVRPNGQVMGGAMYYLSKGLKEMGMGGLGKVLAVMFAVLCIGGSMAGGNSFQVNQSLNAVQETVPFFKDYSWAYGLIMTIAVGVVIIGGIKRIASTAEKIVPSMCAIYVLACLYILFSHGSEIPTAFRAIYDGAFNSDAAFGGFIGVLVVGFKRAAFSNEAGVGSAAIAHSAAKTEFPVREGIVALLEPFIDTIVVCTMTALVIVIAGAYPGGELAEAAAPFVADNNGAGLTSMVFGQDLWWFPYILSVAVSLFAFSTMISWSYYGERCWSYLFGDKSSLVYKVIFLVFTFIGSIVTSTQILEFGDLMILGMAFPNVLGVVLLSGKVRNDLTSYWSDLKSDKFPTYK
ncbi:MAG: alanine:cation symporter family protein [Planctomycetes bacterium]|nr:alanine:cation symporter family protein [Planctomycetota bacterium]MCP4770091.1 alanine:cation symporter family protein [Planctomycetota bacterium]MCP4860761.1 alanine:cation symporter family protein [Planctomycetota bacterium]